LFKLDEAFGALDRYESGFITTSEFGRILADYGIYTDNNDLVGLVDRFDKSQ